jgi:glycosidase
MGENPDVEGRTSVRTPMQWAPGPSGGFSSAPPSRLLVRPPSGGWSPEHVNVVEQRHDENSLMRFISRLIVRHRTSPEIGWGELDILECDADEVLAHSLTAPIGRMVAIHNFAPEALEVTIKVDGEPKGTILSDLMAPGEQPIGPNGRTILELEAYGHRWLRVVRPGDKRLT